MYLVCGEALYDVFIDSENAMGDLYLKGLVGGSPYNVAIGISRLEGSSALFTAVSGDMLGARLVSRLDLEKVDTSFIIRSGRRTTISLVGLDEAGQPGYVFYGTGSADCSVEIDQLPVLGPEIKGLHFGSYSLVVDPAAGAYAELCRRHRDRFVSIDPNVRLNVEQDVGVWRRRIADMAKLANVIKISAEDIGLLYGACDHAALANGWLEGGAKLVIITDGGSEVSAWTSSGLVVSHKPSKTRVVDTVGAGDSFQSALLVKLAELGNGDPLQAVTHLTEEKLRDILRFTSLAAGITCTRRGADLPRLSEMHSLDA